MRGKNVNLEIKAGLLAFEGAGERGSRKKGGFLGENVLLTDEVFFNPPLDGGLDGGGADVSDNKGSRPTGTRFSSWVGRGKLGLFCG